MARITRSKLARADLRDIWLYVAQNSAEAADRVLDRIHRVVEMLAENKLLGEEQNELRKGLRRFVAGNYLVFYQPTDEGIRVVRILHAARRWEDEF
jgi:toxin ParE1/3/4